MQIARAIRDGYDVRGVYYWTLIDNFEWNTGFKMKFGVYSWHPPANRGSQESRRALEEGASQEGDRTLKEGGRLLARYFRTWPAPLPALRRHCQVRCRRLHLGCLLHLRVPRAPQVSFAPRGSLAPQVSFAPQVLLHLGQAAAETVPEWAIVLGCWLYMLSTHLPPTPAHVQVEADAVPEYTQPVSYTHLTLPTTPYV